MEPKEIDLTRIVSVPFEENTFIARIAGRDDCVVVDPGLEPEKTIAELSSEYGVHSNQIRQWKKKLVEELPDIFSDRRKRSEKEGEELTSELYRQIGQLKVELDWLKKKSEMLR